MGIGTLVKDFVKAHPKDVIWYAILLFTGTTTGLVGVTKATAALFQSASNNQKGRSIHVLALVIILTIAVTGINYGIDYIENRMAPNFHRFTKYNMLHKVFASNRTAFLNLDPMKYRAFIKATTESSYQVFYSIIKTYAPNAVLVSVLLGFLFSLDWRYGVTFLTGSGVVAGFFFKNRRKLMEQAQTVEQHRRQTDSEMFDVLQCLPTVISKNTVDEETKHLKDLMDDSTERHIALNQAFDKLNYLSSLTVMIVIFSTMGIAISKMGTKTPVNDIVTALSLMAALRGKIGSISTTNLHVVTEIGKHGANDLDEINRRMAQPEGQSGQLQIRNDSLWLDFEHVSFRYPNSQRNVFNDFCWKVTPGINCLQAPSGTGKTTLSKLILRLYDPVKGKILLNGKPIQEYDVASVRKKCLLSNQDIPLRDLNIRETLTYGIEIAPATVQQFWDTVKDMFMGKTLESPIGKNGNQLSTGQKQILRMGNVLMNDAAHVVILDEPTSGLDMGHKKSVLQIIKQMGLVGKTVLLISHDAETAKIASNHKILVPKISAA